VGHAWVGDLFKDVRHGARQLARARGFTAAATAALTLGIGAATVIFCAVDAVLLRPLPYAEPDRLVVVLHDGRSPVAPATFGAIRAQASSFSAVGVAEVWHPNLAADGGALSVAALRLTADVLRMTGSRPLVGRAFTEAEEEPGREHVVLLGHALWQRAFAGDATVVGRTVRLEGTPYAVVGVMPPGFDFPPFWARGAEMWAPLALRDRMGSWNGRSLRLFAQLAPGVPLARAREEVAAVASRVEAEHPGTMKGLVVRPLQDVVVRNVRPALLVLLGAVGLLLLIACANVAHLLLARAAGRAREMAVRQALGAGRGRLIRQALAESALVAGLGAAGGIAVACAGVRALVAWRPPSVPRIETMALDLRVLAAAVTASILCGLAFGILPALASARRDAQPDLKDGERGSSARGGRLRDALVASEIALALVLLVGAGLLVRTFAALGAIDPGFDPKGVLTMAVSLSGSSENAPGRRAAFVVETVERLRATPGVEAASAINHLPIAGDVWGLPYHAEGRPLPAPGEEPAAAWRVVLPGYFRAMRLPLVRGRDFDAQDTVGRPGVVIVNETLAAAQWPGRDPIGRTLAVGAIREPRWLTVVGVARDAVRGEWSAAPAAEVYVPFLQCSDYLEGQGSQYASMTLVARTAGAPAALAPAARAIVHGRAPDAAIASLQSMDDVVAGSFQEPRLYVVLLVGFATVALALAAVGIYGVVSHTVARRRQEIAIRMALGAGPSQVLRLVLAQGMRAVAIGAAAGLCAAGLLGGSLSSLLYGVSPWDPVTLASVAALLAAVALLATYVPARRAMAIRALSALRHD
jgi:putative ABC transport system permease protein